jgi:hypothetical protein
VDNILSHHLNHTHSGGIMGQKNVRHNPLLHKK